MTSEDQINKKNANSESETGRKNAGVHTDYKNETGHQSAEIVLGCKDTWSKIATQISWIRAEGVICYVTPETDIISINAKHVLLIYTRNKSASKQRIWSTIYRTGNHHQWKTKVINGLQQMHNDKGSEHAVSSAELQQSGSPMIVDELCNICTLIWETWPHNYQDQTNVM